jgi:hypothetical protein
MNQKFKMLRQLMAAIIIITAIVGLSSCEKYTYMPEVINPTDSVHFQAEIQPIFDANCVTCHGPIKAPNLRDGYSYKALTEGGYVDQPGETSKLYSKMTGAEHTPRSTDVDKQKVLIWINQGAHNN